MSWIGPLILVCALALVVSAALVRRAELARMALSVRDREEARSRGSHDARLQHPHVDLTRCMGCGLCVSACPEEGVLDVIHGQARVVHGARCVGHGRCAEDCPVDAIAITLGDVSERTDLPAIADNFEAINMEGLFLAGEVTGFALVRTAIAQGTAVAREVARRRADSAAEGGSILDLLVVGTGPAGLACSLSALEHGLDCLAIEQDTLGGTVAHYPRQKLVMSQPIELPLHGKLSRTTYLKEELIEIWGHVAREHSLPIATGERLESIAQQGDGTFVVQTTAGQHLARNVCLALGRRGTPRRLGVPGESLSKVTYNLIDAQAFQGQSVLVVGGGDSAIEAALGLASQPGARVTLSYRKHAFFRIKARNEARVIEAIANGAIDVRFESEVESIELDTAVLATKDGPVRIANDHVIILAGGIPPFSLLEKCGISFDPADRKAVAAPTESGSGIVKALVWALALAALILVWSLWHGNYYNAPSHLRSEHPDHGMLRPSHRLGLAAGIAATVAVLANLAYLLRRSRRIPLSVGSLRHWMTLHVATGIAGFLFAMVHGGFQVRDTAGGHAIMAMGVLITTGAIGRYLYAFIPRAANGRELALEEVQARLAGLDGEWDGDHPEFRHRVRGEVARLIAEGHWSRSLQRRLLAALTSQRRLREAVKNMRAEGLAAGVPAHRVDNVLHLAHRAHRTALAAARYEELRGMLSGWRYLHRWVALLFVLVLGIHVVTALRFGSFGGIE